MASRGVRSVLTSDELRGSSRSSPVYPKSLSWLSSLNIKSDKSLGIVKKSEELTKFGTDSYCESWEESQDHSYDQTGDGIERSRRSIEI